MNLKTKIEKLKLLNEIKANRKRHIDQYNEAVVEFKSEYLKKLKEMIDNADKEIILYIQLRKPESHEEDYNLIISMLEMSSETHIEITQDEFENYVLDKWPWRDSFVANTMHYVKGK